MIVGTILTFPFHFTVVHKYTGKRHGSQSSKEREQDKTFGKSKVLRNLLSLTSGKASLVEKVPVAARDM